jgi:hypothetical protein
VQDHSLTSCGIGVEDLSGCFTIPPFAQSFGQFEPKLHEKSAAL